VTTFVIVPTYNEAANLEPLVSELLAQPVALNLVVVDDGSPDGTGDLADRLASQHPDQMTVIHRPRKLGLGTAYLAGFRRALELAADNVMTMDADFSHHPRYIPAMVDLSASRAVVIGSRYVAGGGTRGSPLQRRLLSRGANAFARTLLGLRAHDATAGFRLYRREVLESVALDSIFSSGYSFLVEMLYLVQQAGWQVGEVPITFQDRYAGKSKISQGEIVRALYTVLRLAYRRLKGWLMGGQAASGRPANSSPRLP
jgi:dolichol-phosphate mannosyltransferase